MSQLEGELMLVDNVNYRCERERQSEARKVWRDLIAAAVEPQPFRGTEIVINPFKHT